jgi:hypothetical protein
MRPRSARRSTGRRRVRSPPGGRRVDAVPAPSRQLLETMACLGGRVELSLLQAATGEPADLVERLLAPALEEGCSALEPGDRPAVRFRHDRIREAVFRRLDPRSDASCGWPSPGASPRCRSCSRPRPSSTCRWRTRSTTRPSGATRWVCCAAPPSQAALIGDHALVEALLAAALRLVDPADTGTLVELRTGRHAALFSQGRLEEADEEYRPIEAARPTRSTGRGDRSAGAQPEPPDPVRRALELGLRTLAECGIAVPDTGRFADELGDGSTACPPGSRPTPPTT